MQNVQCTYSPLEQELVDAINAIEQRREGSDEVDQFGPGAVERPETTESIDRTVSNGAPLMLRLMAGLRSIGQRRLGLHAARRASTMSEMRNVHCAHPHIEQGRWLR